MVPWIRTRGSLAGVAATAVLAATAVVEPRRRQPAMTASSSNDRADLELESRSVADGVARDTRHQLSLEVTNTRAGTKLRAELRLEDGDEPITLTALDPYTPFPAGVVGLRTHDGSAAFRSVSVRAAG